MGQTDAARIGAFEDLLDRAVVTASGLARAQVDRIRTKYPAAPPAQVVRLLEKRYLAGVTGAGGAVGAAAAIPAVGTGAALALTGGQVGTFLVASATLALAVADVHGVELDDIRRRRTLVLAALLGERGSVLVEQEIGVGTLFWARTLLTRLPLTTVKNVNRTLARRVVKRTATGGAAFALGRLAPLGIGAVIGATGARAMGGTMVKGITRALGPAPATFSRPVEIHADVSPPPPVDRSLQGASGPPGIAP